MIKSSSFLISSLFTLVMRQINLKIFKMIAYVNKLQQHQKIIILNHIWLYTLVCTRKNKYTYIYIYYIHLFVLAKKKYIYIYIYPCTLLVLPDMYVTHANTHARAHARSNTAVYTICRILAQEYSKHIV